MKTYEPQEKYNNSYNISVNTEKNNQNKINLINTNNITFDLPLSMNQNEANSNKGQLLFSISIFHNLHKLILLKN